MPLLNYTTKVAVHVTLGEIHGLLAKHGAKRIMFDYNDDNSIKAISFVVDTPIGTQSIRLPANTDKVMSVLLRQKVKCDKAQAERVAWRIIKEWVSAQMAILETEMVTIDEIFLPYLLSNSGETLYKLFSSNQLLLSEKRENL